MRGVEALTGERFPLLLEGGNMRGVESSRVDFGPLKLLGVKNGVPKFGVSGD